MGENNEERSGYITPQVRRLRKEVRECVPEQVPQEYAETPLIRHFWIVNRRRIE